MIPCTLLWVVPGYLVPSLGFVLEPGMGGRLASGTMSLMLALSGALPAL